MYDYEDFVAWLEEIGRPLEASYYRSLHEGGIDDEQIIYSQENGKGEKEEWNRDLLMVILKKLLKIL